MFPVGITTGYGLLLNKQTLADMKKNGIDYIELSLCREYDVSFQQIGQMTHEAGIGIWSAHLPVRPKDQLDISLESPELRRHTVAHFSELIRQVSDLGVDKFVLHPSTPLPDGCDRKERKKCAMDTMDKLAEVAHSCGAVIAMEDMTLPCLGNSAEELREMISVNDKLRICFDTNHLFNNTHEEFVRLLGDKIVTVHLSDYTETGEKHWFPGEGIVDWPQIPKLLKSVGYNGVWLYELSLNGAKSADRGRPLTLRDFRRNADEIFAGKKPTIVKP